MIHAAGSGHPGGTLSAADLIACLCSEALGWASYDPTDEERNRFVLSKGHACPALYSAASEFGLIPRSELAGFRKLNRKLQGHPHVGATPWVETSTGSLGQGFSVSIGLALGLRFQQRSSMVYTLLGDGELQEGQIWEGAMTAGHYRLGNLCAIIDYNRMQSDDLNENIIRLEPLRAKWEAFNWHVEEIDGHCFDEMRSVISQSVAHEGSPTMVIAHTIKGKGVSYMESDPLWHGSVCLRDDELMQGLSDLDTTRDEYEEWLRQSTNNPS